MEEDTKEGYAWCQGNRDDTGTVSTIVYNAGCLFMRRSTSQYRKSEIENDNPFILDGYARSLPLHAAKHESLL